MRTPGRLHVPRNRKPDRLHDIGCRQTTSKWSPPPTLPTGPIVGPLVQSEHVSPTNNEPSGCVPVHALFPTPPPATVIPNSADRASAARALQGLGAGVESHRRGVCCRPPARRPPTRSAASLIVRLLVRLSGVGLDETQVDLLREVPAQGAGLQGLPRDRGHEQEEAVAKTEEDPHAP